MFALRKHTVVRGLVLAAALLAIGLRLPAAVPTAAAPLFKITDASFGLARHSPEGIVVGPDGNFWITFQVANTIGRLTPAGLLDEFPIPTPNAQPMELTVGKDNNMWFAEYGTVGQLGRITTAGAIQQFPVLTKTAQLYSVAWGPDNNVWFTEWNNHAIGRMAPDGSAVIEFSLPVTTSMPADITVGPDNNIWFTEWGGDRIGRVDNTLTCGNNCHITEYQLASFANPIGIIAGPDGNIWFVESGAAGGKVARLTPQFDLTEFPTPTQITPPERTSGPVELTIGPDGLIWIAEAMASKIASVTLDGHITEYDVPTPDSFPCGLVTGPDGKLWYIGDAAFAVDPASTERYGVADVATHAGYLPILTR